MKLYYVKLTILFLFTDIAVMGAPKKPLHETDFKTIIENYLFIDDFSTKPPFRDITDQLFWQYRYRLPTPHFKVHAKIDAPDREMPASPGQGLPFYHINRGRVLFTKGQYMEARNVWLGARARFGNEWELDRRNDYYLALAFMKIGNEGLKAADGDFNNLEVRSSFSNAAAFLNWAYFVKEAKQDPVVERMAPKQLYNLSAIYFNYGRYAGAYGAADRGLKFSKLNDRYEYKSYFQRILAESFIQNRSYLEAIQMFDSILRNNVEKPMAADIFARTGDIYYDLNNFELAEYNYALSHRISHESGQIDLQQMILRGESLFWLGKFDQAHKILKFALNSLASKKVSRELPVGWAEAASLRAADSLLASNQTIKAQVAYDDVAREFVGSEAAKVAKIRLGCLELPTFGKEADDNNVGHTRRLLEASKQHDIAQQARELAWACHVMSYAERERSEQMLERVKKFYEAYPYAKRFLKKMVNPVREFQATKIEFFFAAEDWHGAASFFEGNRKTLFKTVPAPVRRELFKTYTNIYKSKEAKPFLEAFDRLEKESDKKLIREAVYFAETGYKHKRLPESKLLKQMGARKWTIERTEWAELAINRIKATKTSAAQLKWIMELEKIWALKDQNLICTNVIPTMNRYFISYGKDNSKFSKQVEAFIAPQMPDMIRKDEVCGISLLEFEFDVFQKNPEKLAAVYQSRLKWPMIDSLVSQFWSIAEYLMGQGQTSVARQLYREIAERGPANSAKVNFAKLRLSEKQTEFEKIWK
jgi:tetratricopeptide (TPR) repeat protein